ncbi:hypothetical protein EYF80_015916 [Liparis tanakae]|uniref:Uncharacterized protein n=1 Tax=Liparis tanakae TaxID=230148 RepID=A0A4Z2I765_9TELE|nr:hypothetical protein EYF80_015916 [Liparis tanakae]
MLYAELAYGVVHEDREVFHRHPHVPVAPAALIGPVLVALVLGRDDSRQFVSMTIVATFCSQIVLQKSATVSSFGPSLPSSAERSLCSSSR